MALELGARMVDRRKVQVNLSFKQRVRLSVAGATGHGTWIAVQADIRAVITAGERRFAAALAFAKRGDQGYTF